MESSEGPQRHRTQKERETNNVSLRNSADKLINNHSKVGVAFLQHRYPILPFTVIGFVVSAALIIKFENAAEHQRGGVGGSQMYAVDRNAEWKQQWRVHSRKADEAEKAHLKLLTALSEADPQNAGKANGLLTEHEVATQKADRETKAIFAKLRKIHESIAELRESLKYFDRTNESLMKVQRLSEGVFAKMEAMRSEMADGYDSIDDSERRLSADL
jgi:hypothetical protein